MSGYSLRTVGYPVTPDEVAPQSPDDMEDLLEEHSPEDYFHLSIPVMDTFRSTRFPSRRHGRSSIHQNMVVWPADLRHRSTSPLPIAAPLPKDPSTEGIDLRSLEYVGPFDHNLMCAICRCPFVRPVQLDCFHIFCRDCVNQALMHQPREARCCPTCRSKKGPKIMTPGPKIINCIVDDLIVKCPLTKDGCAETMARASVQDHVERYCDFSDIKCPSEECAIPIRRKDMDQKRCLHSLVDCEYCGYSIMERDLEIHCAENCPVRKGTCPDCKTELLYCNLEAHSSQCPEALSPCTAAPYGCDFTSKRLTLASHLQTCPLAKLTPFISMQSSRLNAHETALAHLQRRNSLLQSSLATIQDTLSLSTNLVDTPSASNPTSELSAPFDSTAHHLLSLHESLREEVERVSHAVSELDAKASMMVMNESLRAKEDMAHMNAAVGSLRVQLHWLMSARLQNQQRAAMVRTQSPGEGAGVRTETAEGGSSSALGMRGPVRRLSDSTRQETKL
ncbi:hypothetical protein MMC12_005690 [Toensbergia leucococca]|nr:hypothetical protein [Toensbergia leucococca]